MLGFIFFLPGAALFNATSEQARSAKCQQYKQQAYASLFWHYTQASFKTISKMSNKVEDNSDGDKVILHQFPPTRVVLSPSPYPIKFETYLRIASIPYENDFKKYMSSKGKSPWMTFRGKDMADSQICMDHLAETLGKDLSEHLSTEEKAISRGLRAIMEDHLYFVVAMNRWVFGDRKHVKATAFGNLQDMGIPKLLEGFIVNRLGKSFKRQAVGQGMGKHTEAEIQDMGKKDLRALSDYLGTKEYLFGDKPVETDCVLFGFMAQFLFVEPKEHVLVKYIEEECSNLKEHCMRIKEKYWTDWDDRLYSDNKI